jgi:hypothetical protein
VKNQIPCPLSSYRRKAPQTSLEERSAASDEIDPKPKSTLLKLLALTAAELTYAAQMPNMTARIIEATNKRHFELSKSARSCAMIAGSNQTPRDRFNKPIFHLEGSLSALVIPANRAIRL